MMNLYLDQHMFLPEMYDHHILGSCILLELFAEIKDSSYHVNESYCSNTTLTNFEFDFPFHFVDIEVECGKECPNCSKAAPEAATHNTIWIRPTRVC